LFEMITRWPGFVDIESQGRIESNPGREPGRIARLEREQDEQRRGFFRELVKI